MNIRPFAVEEWMNEYEDGARYNIAETCVDSVSLDKLFALTGEDRAAFLADFGARRLTYGAILARLNCGRASPGFTAPYSRAKSCRRTARRARITMCSAR